MKRNKGLRLTKTKPIPDAYRFYAEVFGATERMRFPGPGGTLAHAEIQIVDSVVIVEDESPEQGSKAPPPGGVAGAPSSTRSGTDGRSRRTWRTWRRRRWHAGWPSCTARPSLPDGCSVEARSVWYVKYVLLSPGRANRVIHWAAA